MPAAACEVFPLYLPPHSPYPLSPCLMVPPGPSPASTYSTEMHRSPLRSLLLAAASVLSVRACGSAHGNAGPQDSPTATLYGNGSYTWAETMVPWQCVFNIIDYPGKPDVAFAAAQGAAVAAGGGVVFFPAGVYAFANNVALASNVVIRGVATTARAKSGKNAGPLAPTTIFECPDREHQGIINTDPNASSLGVVNIELRSCAIMLWPGLLPAAPSPLPWPASLKTYWYGATGVAGQGRRKLVLGNKVRAAPGGLSIERTCSAPCVRSTTSRMAAPTQRTPRRTHGCGASALPWPSTLTRTRSLPTTSSRLPSSAQRCVPVVGSEV